MATSKELRLAKEGEGSPLYPSSGGNLAPVCHNLRLQILQQQQIDGSFLSISVTRVRLRSRACFPFTLLGVQSWTDVLGWGLWKSLSKRLCTRNLSVVHNFLYCKWQRCWAKKGLGCTRKQGPVGWPNRR